MQQDSNLRAMTGKQALNVPLNNSPIMPVSLGERVSRLLVVSMAVCLVYAILLVQEGFVPGQSSPLLPIWAIFLLLLIFSWLARGLRRFVGQGTGAPVLLWVRKMLSRLVTGCALLPGLLFCLWLHLYARHYMLFDLAWLQAFANDAGQLDIMPQVLAFVVILCIIVGLSYLIATRKEANGAMLLSRGGVLLAGLAVLCLVESIFGSNPDYWQAFLLLPLFFWSGLTTQSLQKASAKRRYHVVGLEGNTRYQEQIIFRVMLLFGLVVLVIILAVIQVHGGVVPLISRMVAGLALPIIAAPVPPDPHPHPQKWQGISGGIGIPQKTTSKPLFQTLSALSIWQALLGFAVCLLVLGALAFLVILLVRWLKRRKQRAKAMQQDRVESIWNWSLFLAQLRALFKSQLRALLLAMWSLLRPLRSRLRASNIPGVNKIRLNVPELHTIREIYRVFLRKARQRGYQRARAETPHEFRVRLSAQEPAIDPELGIITEAYTLARYGGSAPGDDELVQIEASWRELEHKWE